MDVLYMIGTSTELTTKVHNKHGQVSYWIQRMLLELEKTERNGTIETYS